MARASYVALFLGCILLAQSELELQCTMAGSGGVRAQRAPLKAPSMASASRMAHMRTRSALPARSCVHWAAPLGAGAGSRVPHARCPGMPCPAVAALDLPFAGPPHLERRASLLPPSSPFLFCLPLLPSSSPPLGPAHLKPLHPFCPPLVPSAVAAAKKPDNKPPKKECPNQGPGLGQCVRCKGKK